MLFTPIASGVVADYYRIGNRRSVPVQRVTAYIIAADSSKTNFP